MHVFTKMLFDLCILYVNHTKFKPPNSNVGVYSVHCVLSYESAKENCTFYEMKKKLAKIDFKKTRMILKTDLPFHREGLFLQWSLIVGHQDLSRVPAIKEI